MASVHKQAGSRNWIAHFIDSSGRRRGKSTHVEAVASTRKKAQKVADAYEGAYRARNAVANIRESFASIAKELNVEFRPPTVKAFLADWMATYGVRLAESSRAKYAGVFNGFTSYLGDADDTLYVDAVTIDHARGYRDAMLARLSQSTVNTSVTILSGAFHRAISKGFMVGNPFEDLGGIVGDAPGERRPFTIEELKLVLGVCGPEWRSLVLGGLYTALRLGDLAALTWGQIDIERGEIGLTTRKTKRRQALPIAPPLLAHIRTLRRGLPENPLHPEAHAVVTREGKAGTLSRRFNEILQEAGLVPKKTHKKTGAREDCRRTFNELSFHSLRHTNATWLRAVGASESVAREIVGHDSVSVDRRYVHADPRGMREALDKLPNVLAS